ncbi:MAG: hypothetical protein GC154_06735 [bacterium]|nr:hypothetical protein [bacterium]
MRRARVNIRRPFKRNLVDQNLILIVCEGEKTEPYYFRSLVKHWRIRPATVRIIGEECGSSPINVVDFAVEQKNGNLKKVKKGESAKFDEIWCVFDHEGVYKHQSFDQALDKAQSNDLKVAFSVPCFEFWYMLHYKYSTSKFECADSMISAFKKEAGLKKYSKSGVPFDALIDKLPFAFNNATQLRQDYENRSEGIKTRWPYTEVDLLVKVLKAYDK